MIEPVEDPSPARATAITMDHERAAAIVLLDRRLRGDAVAVGGVIVPAHLMPMMRR
jgi:hypothetical protein